jgi:type VII secretion-associated serine protease mycosin
VRRRRIHAVCAASLVVLIAVSPAAPAQADGIRSSEWHLAYLKVSQAQSITKGTGVVVGVVDSGVYPHPDLRINLLKGTDVASANGGNGQADQEGHGTEMAGLIAGHGSNANEGVLGIAPNAKILPVKFTVVADRGGSTQLGDGVKWAVEHGARVINISATTGPTPNLDDGVAAANTNDVVVIAGTGNRSLTRVVGYPAAMPGVLAVGAIDRSGRHASFSTTGPETQICAPGVDISAPEPKNRYVKIDGTSPATAIVSGAAALVRAKFPKLSAQEVIHRLTATATDIGKPGRDDECGYGVLNIVKALTANVPPLESSATTAPSVSASAAATLPTAAATTPTAEGPETTPTSKATVLVVLGVIVVLVAGGLFAFLAVRRRKSP